MFTPIFSPFTYYHQTAKKAHEQNVQEYFNLLENHAKINREENAQTVANYHEEVSKAEQLYKQVKSKKTL